MTKSSGLPNRSAILIVVIVGVLGLLAGGAYLAFNSGFGNGNNFGDLTTISSADSVATCEEKGDMIASLGPLMTGEVAALIKPESSLPVGWLSFLNGDDTPGSIADYSGQVVLLNLWATWCAPCREEMPALNALQQELGSNNFQVLTINVDTGGMDKPRAFVEETGVLDLPLAHDNTMQIFNDLKSKGRALGMPVTMLIDRDGCEVATINGPAEWASDDAKALIRETIRVTRAKG